MTSASSPYWVNTTGLAPSASGVHSRLAVIPCPPGGDHLPEAMRSLHEHGFATIVSLLCPDEIRILRLEAEPELCREVGIDYEWLPVPDHSIPESIDEFRRIVDRLQRDIHAGKAVGAHCYAGIGRSCMLIAGLLCAEGLDPADAFARLSAARGLRVPDTWLQIQWVEHFAESIKVPQAALQDSSRSES